MKIVVVLLLFGAGCDLLEPPNFVVQRCTKEWVCDGDVAFDDTDDLCVNGNDEAAVSDSATAFAAEFAENCGGVTVSCEEGVDTVCQASCVLTQEACADAGT